MRKKILIAFCLLLIAAMAVSALAAETVSMTVTPAEKTLKQGESVVITVTVAEFADCKGGSLRLEYDSNSFTRSDEEWLLTDMFMNEPTGDAVFAFSKAKTISGDIYRFTLTAKENATLGDSAIAIKLQLKNASDEIMETRQAIKITVSCTHEYGTWNRMNETQHGQTCTKCGNVVKEDHTWDTGKTEIEADCSREGLIIYTCTKCNATKEITTEKLPHAYDNECDTECNNGCGTTREAKHDYSSKWTSDGTNHWHECSVCGDKADVTAHTPGPEATEWDSQTCTVCGKVLKEALGHTHKYGSEWIYDDMGHWYECSGCEELKDYSDHHYDNACDPDCNDCGSVRQIHHEYGHNMWFDASGHWQECIVCSEKTSPEPHSPGPEATEGSAQVCTVCGYELAPALNHTHEYGENWYWDGTGHWQVCSCGIATVREDHNWGEPIITKQPTADEEGEATYICLSCDAEKKEPIPAEEPTEPTQPTQPSQGGTAEPEPKEFPVWILIVAGCILALGLILFLIIGAIIGQKQKGKFSA